MSGLIGLVALLFLSCSEKQKEAARLEEKMRSELYADSNSKVPSNSSLDAPALGLSADSLIGPQDDTDSVTQLPTAGGDNGGMTASGRLQVYAAESLNAETFDSSHASTLSEPVPAPDAGAIPDEEKIKGRQAGGGDGAGGYVVQIASTPDRQYAEIVATGYVKQGYQAYLATALVNEVTYYRVRIGPCSTADSADRVRDELEQKFSVSGLVTRVR
jgi:cell division protein FtsN